MAENKKYLHNLDIENNKVMNLLLNPLTTAQRTAVGAGLGILDQGYVCFDTDLNAQYFWDGTQWITAGGSGTTPNLQQVTDVGNTITDLSGFTTALVSSNQIYINNSSDNIAAGISADIGSFPYLFVQSGGSTIYYSISGIIFGSYSTLFPSLTADRYFALSVNGNYADSTGNITVSAGTGTVTGSGVATRVAFWDTTSSISSDSSLYWDNTNKRLGIGTATPSKALDVVSDALVNGALLGIGPNTGSSFPDTNIVFGTSALAANTTGYYNAAIGTNAMNANTTGYYNLAIGYDALKVNLISRTNIAIGAASLGKFVGDGGVNGGNTGIGALTLRDNVTGLYNTAIGYGSILSVTGSSYNAAIGYSAFRYATSGQYNTAIGTYAGSYYSLAASTTLTTANNGTFIGYYARPLNNNSTNEIVIGYNSVGNGDNSTTIGNSNTTSTNLFGALGFGSTPSYGTSGQVLTSNGTGVAPSWQNGVTGSGTINYVPKWSSASALTDSLIFDNGTSVGIGTATPDAAYKLQVTGIIQASGGINLSTSVGIKTGIYSGTNQMTFWAGNNQLATYRLNGNITGSYFEHTAGFTNSGAVLSGNQNVWRLAGNVTATVGANAINATQLLIDPSYNQGTFGTGILRGVYYNPTVSVLNGSQHTAWENTSGDIIHGNLATGGSDEMVTVDTNGKLKKQVIPSGGGGISSGTASGTDTYTATIGTATSYTNGDAYLLNFTNGNTTTSTLNINGIGAKKLYKNNDGELIGGDIWASGEMLCIYNSTLDGGAGGFQVIGTSPNALYAYVTNDDSVTITKGQVVYAYSGTGDRMTVKLAYNTSDATSAKTVGVVVSSSIAANQKGIIITQGLLDGLSILPTATYTDGDTLYLGATAGSITNVKQYAPNHLVYLGTVTTASNGSAGRWYVRVQNGYELDELHNVQAQSPSLNDTLYYDNGVSPAQWKTASISTILGYTPVASNASITPGTNLKITYDSKGLVTAGTTAATSDLSDVTAWTDYSATSTIVGFTAYATKKIQYKKIDASTIIVQFQIESTAGNGSGLATSFTLPFNASSWGSQYFTYHALNNNTTQAAAVCTIATSSNVVNCYPAGSVGSNWNAATTRHLQGTIIVNI